MIEQARILVVDDDDRIRETLSRALTRTEYSCLTAKDVSEASGILEREDIDLVLLDIKMPGISGMEFLPTIRERYPDVAVVMLSGVEERSTAVWAMREGAYDYAAKPIDTGELVIKIDGALWRLAVVRENNAHQRNLETMADALKSLRVQNRELEVLLQSIQSRTSPDLEGPFSEIKSAVGSITAALDGLIDHAKVVSEQRANR